MNSSYRVARDRGKHLSHRFIDMTGPGVLILYDPGEYIVFRPGDEPMLAGGGWTWKNNFPDDPTDLMFTPDEWLAHGGIELPPGTAPVPILYDPGERLILEVLL